VSGPVYQLWEIPLQRPSVVPSAVDSVDQSLLRSFLDPSEKVSKAALVCVAELAIDSGAVKTADACLPSGTILTFVDLATFPREFEQFVAAVKQNKLDTTEADVVRLIGHKKFRSPSLKAALRAMIRWGTSRDRTLRWLEKLCFKPTDFIRLARHSVFPPVQIHEEIRGLLGVVASARPKEILEIGTSMGGTLYLLTKAADEAANLVSVDLHIADETLFSSFGRKRQHLHVVQGNSRDSKMIESTNKRFPSGVDLLFLDGDHSYDGVKSDFLNYSPLVRDGGLIAFHDIVEDNETRYGVVTGGWSGGVPRFWKEIKSDYRHVEFVRSPDQDGHGIGVLFVGSS